jgi:hypothetical protein
LPKSKSIKQKKPCLSKRNFTEIFIRCKYKCYKKEKANFMEIILNKEVTNQPKNIRRSRFKTFAEEMKYFLGGMKKLGMGNGEWKKQGTKYPLNPPKRGTWRKSQF